MVAPIKTPIDEGFFQRLSSGIRYIVSGAETAWQGPGQPMKPVADSPAEQTKGRLFDYPQNINMRTQKKADVTTGGITFDQLRNLADNCDLVRLAIETRKDQISNMAWDIKKSGSKKSSEEDQVVKDLKKFFKRPDKNHTWATWIRMLIEDVLVIDAPTIYPRYLNNGDLYSLDVLDGATIKRVVDGFGRTPLPPDPAYQQIIKNMPVVNYTQKELIYCPRNPRSWRIYGLSPVEQIIVITNIALRRQAYQLEYFVDGNVPDSLFGVPEDWTSQQIKDFQDWWDAINSEDSRRKGRFIPGGVTHIDTKSSMMSKDEQIANEWIARVICYCFNVSPTQLTVQNNRATSETLSESANDEGLLPLKLWVKDLIDFIIQDVIGHTEYEFEFTTKEEIEPLKKAQIDQIYINAKVLDPAEVRESMGYEPLTPEQIERMTALSAKPEVGGTDEEGEDSEDDDVPSGESSEDKDPKKQPKAKGDKVKKRATGAPSVKVDVHLGDTLVEVGGSTIRTELTDAQIKKAVGHV